MSNLRFIITFFLLVIVIVLAIFQMRIRGYQEVGRINEYVLYHNTDEACINSTIVIEETTFIIECASQYILKSGFTEYTIIDALEEEVVEIDDLSKDITVGEE